MKRKGFTLVELIAVISILIILILLTVPNLINSIANKKQESLNRIKDIIISAGKNYASDNDIDGPANIPLSTLCDSGYATCPINNPVTDDNMNGTVKIDEHNIFTYIDIPSNYQVVEYIKSTGTQYIDTNIKTAQSLKIESEFSTTTPNLLYFGGRTTTTTDAIVFGFFTNDSSFVGFGGTSANYSTTVNLIDGNRHKVVLSNDIYRLDGIDQVISNRTTLAEYNNIYIGTWNTNGTADSRMFVGNIYTFNIWKDGTLVRSFIPCYRKSDNVAGLYDIVEGVFYTSAGSNSFEIDSNA